MLCPSHRNRRRGKRTGVAAAEFAVSAQAEKSEKEISLVEVIKAERQVVAGSNYRMCLKVTTQGEVDEADATHFVQVVVYVDLKGTRKLSSWVASAQPGLMPPSEAAMPQRRNWMPSAPKFVPLW